MILVKRVRHIISVLLIAFVLLSISVFFASAGSITHTSTIQSNGKFLKKPVKVNFTSVTNDIGSIYDLDNALKVTSTRFNVTQMGNYYALNYWSVDHGSIINNAWDIWRDVKGTVNFSVGGSNTTDHSKTNTHRHSIIR